MREIQAILEDSRISVTYTSTLHAFEIVFMEYSICPFAIYIRSKFISKGNGDNNS